MVNRNMDEILRKLNLEHFVENFKEQKISPDIMCILSSRDLGNLGITNKQDVVIQNCVFDTANKTIVQTVVPRNSSFQNLYFNFG